MLDPEKSPWYAAVAGGAFWFFWYVRKLMRRDKEDGSASGLTVAMTDATQRVIKMLETRIDALVKEVHSLRDELKSVLKHKHDCDQQNLKLINEVKELSKRVTVVEKDSK